MKEGQARGRVDYIRFSMELEGSGFPAESEEMVSSILDGSRSADEVVSGIISTRGLGGSYEAGFDEQSNYPGTKCLVNYFNIRDKALLREVEHLLVNARTAELFVDPPKGNLTFTCLCEIHARLFGDIYPSAGRIRTLEASKRKEFCRPDLIEANAREIFAKLSRDNWLRDVDDRGDFLNDLAFYMGEVEALHPFRDGNGRAARYFFNKLVEDAGHEILWSETDPDRMLEASIAAIDGDCQLLVDVLDPVLLPLDD